MPHLLFLCVCLIWGSNFILMSRAGHALSPIDIAFGRLLFGGITLGIAWLFSKRQKLPRSAWGPALLLVIFAHVVPFLVQPALIGRGFGHSFFGFMVAFVPLLTITVSIPMLGTWPTWREMVGVIGGLVALGMLIWDGRERGMGIDTLALAFSVPAVYAWGNTFIRLKMRDVPIIPLTSTLYLTGALLLLPCVLWPEVGEWLGTPRPSPGQDWPQALASVAWLGSVGTGLAGLTFVWLIQQRGPLFAGMVSYLVPLVALGWGAFDDEPITPRQLFAVATVLAMVALVQTQKKT